MDLAWLVTKLKEYPKVKIVFDTKEDVNQILQVMLAYCEQVDFDLRARMVVQIYSIEDYHAVHDLGFREYWFSNYKVNYSATTIAELFDGCRDVTTYVMWYNLWSTWYQQGITFNKKVAVHSLSRTAELAAIEYAAAHGVNYVYVD